MNVIFAPKTDTGAPAFWKEDIINDGNIYVTLHAAKRLKERNGWSRRTSIRMIKRILSDGITEKDFSGKQKLWVKNHKRDYSERNSYVIYGDKVYIFQDNMLITLHEAPKKKYTDYRTRKSLLYLEAV